MGMQRERKPNGMKCEVCGKPLLGRQSKFCSFECRNISVSLEKMQNKLAQKVQEVEEKVKIEQENAEAERLEELKKKEDIKRRLAEIERRKTRCNNCVWKNGNVCVMPSCLKDKGMGYKRYDT